MYNYKAMDTMGKQRTGVINAKSSQEANTILKERGLFPLSITEKEEPKDEAKKLFFVVPINEHGTEMAVEPELRFEEDAMELYEANCVEGYNAVYKIEDGRIKLVTYNYEG